MDRTTIAGSVPRAAGVAAGVTRRGFVAGTGAGIGMALLPRVPAFATPPTLAADHSADVLHGWVGVLYNAQRDALATPTSAARLYGLAMLAAYEAALDGMPDRQSLGGQLNGLSASPVTRGNNIHWPTAVNAAIAEIAVAASWDRSDSIRATLTQYGIDTHAALAIGQPPGLAKNSARHGKAVGAWLAAWAETDKYRETRTMDYTAPRGPGLWRSTPPNFGTAIEPHWHQVRPFALRVTRDRADKAVDPAAPPRPIPYDPTPGSRFYKQAEAVMAASAALTTEQRVTAFYWRDNPDTVTGLPSGHWLQIAIAAAQQRNLNLADTVEVAAVMAICVADAFTSCWIEKYRSNLLRPVTYINDHIVKAGDQPWVSNVNTPQFPEYTSGHSVSSAAAAVALASLLGDGPFTDTYAAGRVVGGVTLTARTFPTFTAAAEEAGVSRLYGGIHYPMGIERGLTHGRDVARLVLAAAKTKKGNGRR